MKKALVIEDEKKWQEVLKQYLEEADCYVEVVNNLTDALQKIRTKIYHFITIDLFLPEDKNDQELVEPEKYEGWDILKEIIKAGHDRNTGTMVITGFPEDYLALKGIKKVSGLYFMSKNEFNKKKFIKTVSNFIKIMDYKFFDDKP
jgi:CheY-like chemotaxis protein